MKAMPPTKQQLWAALLFWLTCIPAANSQPGYPIETFLGFTRIEEVAISSNGKKVAVVTIRDDFTANREVTSLWEIDIDTSGQALPPKLLSKGDISQLRWSVDGRWLAFLEGDVLRVLGNPRPILPQKGVASYDWLPSGDLVFASFIAQSESKDRVQRYPRPNPYSRIVHWREGKSPLVLATVEGSIQKLRADPVGHQLVYQIGLANAFDNDIARVELFTLPLNGGTPKQLTRNIAEEGSVQWSQNGRNLLALVTGDPQRRQLAQDRIYQFDATTGEALNAAPDFGGSFLRFQSLADSSLLAVAQVSTTTRFVQVLSGRTHELASFRGAVGAFTATKDGQYIVFALTDHDQFPALYLARGFLGLKNATRITDFNQGMRRWPVPETEVVQWDNGSGQTVEGVVFWPPGQRGSTGLPLVISLHGGPDLARSEAIALGIPWAFYPALLASRGYLVIEPNFRGSTGRGDAFMAIAGKTCSLPAEDVLSGADFLVKRGWANENKLGLFGYSFGGELTGCLLGRSDRFKVAVAGSGIWNEISYYGTAENGALTDTYFASKPPWASFETYWQESPLSRVDHIHTPTLLTTGGADDTVPPTQSFEFYRGLRANRVPTQLIVFPGQSHDYTRPSFKRSKVEAEIAWIDCYLLHPP